MLQLNLLRVRRSGINTCAGIVHGVRGCVALSKGGCTACYPSRKWVVDMCWWFKARGCYLWSQRIRAERLGPIGKDKCWWTCEAAILWSRRIRAERVGHSGGASAFFGERRVCLPVASIIAGRGEASHVRARLQVFKWRAGS